MDFGAVGFDGFVCSEGGFAPFLSEAETKEKWRRSGLSKQGRSEPVEDDWRGLKMARQEDFGLSKAMLMQSKNLSMLGSGSLFSDGQQQLLSFSSPKSDGVLIGSDRSVDRRYQNELLPYHLTSTFGLRSGSLNGNMHCGTLSGVRGPFTPSQWMELEHQALIYKYLTSNVPIPSNLLIPIRGSLNPSGFSVYTAGCLRPNSLGWGSFQMDYSGNTDPEPGRCRRTDGKKWRCSRDAVADQKYCERHMNRGRHRSRKPVEGQTGHASSATDATIKTMPAITSSSPSTIPSCLKSNSLPISQQLMKSLRPDVDSSSTHGSRILMNKMNVDDQMQDPQSLSVQSTIYPKPKDTLFPNPKQNVSFADSSNAELGLVNSNSLLNPHRGSYDHNDQDSQSHPLRHFIDDWPKSRSDHSTITWPYLEEIQIDKTQLSISIPVASAEFSSSTSSPTKEKLTLSPLKLSHELDPIQMNLGVGGVHESTERDANWMPISWKTSMGGPLGEVLNNTSNTSRCQKNSSTLDLMTEGWDGNPQVGSSPTGVLQKTSFAASLSNSSTGSSPRTEVNKSHDHISLCDDLLGSTLVT